MKQKPFWQVLLISLILLLLLAACGGGDTADTGTEAEVAESAEEPAAEVEEAMDEEPFKIAFVYVAPIGDLGWTYAHDQARLEMEETFGDKIETVYI